jgi:hypothetical protein
VHSYLQDKTNAIVDNLEIAVVKFLNFVERSQVAKPTATKPTKAKF